MGVYKNYGVWAFCGFFSGLVTALVVRADYRFSGTALNVISRCLCRHELLLWIGSFAFRLGSPPGLIYRLPNVVRLAYCGIGRFVAAAALYVGLGRIACC